MDYNKSFQEVYNAGLLIITMLKAKGWKVSWWNLAEILRGLIQTAESVIEGVGKGSEKKKLVKATWKALDRAFKLKKKLPFGFLRFLPFGIYNKIVDVGLEVIVWLLKTFVWKDIDAKKSG